MAQKKIIVDSNSYFRLAQNIHPLLCQPFGREEYTLYIHADLNDEFRRSPRLKNKFHWVVGPIYVENRSRSISLTQGHKTEIDITYDYLGEHVQDAFIRPHSKGPSPIDTRIVATAQVLRIPVLTDDRDMIKLAKDFGVDTLSSLEVMKLMLEANHIDDDKVNQVVEQWIYENDTPHRDWRKEFKQLFGLEAPANF
jgi:hypothetical protein